MALGTYSVGKTKLQIFVDIYAESKQNTQKIRRNGQQATSLRSMLFKVRKGDGRLEKPICECNMTRHLSYEVKPNQTR